MNSATSMVSPDSTPFGRETYPPSIAARPVTPVESSTS